MRFKRTLAALAAVAILTLSGSQGLGKFNSIDHHLSNVESAHAVLPPESDACAYGQLSIFGSNVGADGNPTRINLAMVLSCKTGTIINGSAWIQRYIPLNNGWQNVDADAATTQSVQSINFWTPCYPTSPSGATIVYRGEALWHVTYPDGQKQTLIAYTAQRGIKCEALFG